MKRTPTMIAALSPLLLVAAGVVHRDVNQDGRTDMDDVRALGRMVAGLDASDLAFDQDGDGALTTNDISVLYDFVGSAGATSAPATPLPQTGESADHATPTPSPTQSLGSPTAGSTRYLVVEQASDGRVVVAVGAAGVKPGDRVLGVYDSFSDAEAERVRIAGGAPPEMSSALRSSQPGSVFPPARGAPISTPPPKLAVINSEIAGAIEVIPLGVGAALVVRPGWREGWFLQSARSQSTAVSIRRQPLEVAADTDAALVTPCPYFGSSGKLEGLFGFSPARGEGNLLRGIGSGRGLRSTRVTMSPTLRGQGGRIVLLQRRGEQGETTAVYLYHWPSGTVLYVPRLEGGPRRLRAHRLDPFPKLSQKPVVIPVTGDAGATRSFVFLDTASGEAWCILNVRPDPDEPKPVRTRVNLNRLAAPNTAGRLQLAATPLVRADGTSSEALVVDSDSGRLAVLAHDDDPSVIRLDVLEQSIDSVIPQEGSPRRLFAAPASRPGSALILDTASGRAAVVRVRSGQPTTIEPMTVP